MNKPKCIYTGKSCPEKPFYVRSFYPLGEIIDRDPKGCNRWLIDRVVINEGKPNAQIIQKEMCVDMWNAFYMSNYAMCSRGNQKVTEQLRNGLCVEVQKGIWQPKPEPTAILLTKLVEQIINNNHELTYKSGINQLDAETST